VNLPATTVVVPSGAEPLERPGGAAETGEVRPRLLAITLGDAVQKVTAVVKDLEGPVVVRG
jgi:hypothetical protein